MSPTADDVAETLGEINLLKPTKITDSVVFFNTYAHQ